MGGGGAIGNRNRDLHGGLAFDFLCFFFCVLLGTTGLDLSCVVFLSNN